MSRFPLWIPQSGILTAWLLQPYPSRLTKPPKIIPSHLPDLHYNHYSPKYRPPHVLMSLTRPKLQLDEQSFQDLLAAAFTIQQHADLLKQVNEISSRVAPELETAPKLCPRCAAPLKKGESRCARCSVEELRPGERMQHKFASLWEMSQEHGIRQQRPPEHHQESVLELASSGLVVSPQSANQSQEQRAFLQDAAPQETELETDPPVEAESAVHSIPLEMTEDDSLLEANDLNAGPRTALENFRQQLDLHRADLYLGIAVLVALLAFLWPAPAPPQKPLLSAWQRVLVNLGIAEVPAPAIHYRGDPNVEVWVDPHTALYYCPGDEQYGKAADGRLTSQRDAQADRFEPASRAACN